MQQKEETFQVIIDVIKNSTCFKAFTISTDIPEIFMQQSWYTIKKVKDSDSYEFLLANKKCIVDADVFRKILDICPRVEVEEFTEVQDDDATLNFLFDLSYKGPLHKYTNILIIGRKENQDVKICHSPDSPKSSSITFSYNTHLSPTSNIDTFIQSRMMVFNQNPIKYFSNTPLVKFLPRRAEGKFHKGRRLQILMWQMSMCLKSLTLNQPEIKLLVKEWSRRKSQFTADNIIPGPYVALELGKFISLTEAVEEEAAREVHATHARIVTKSVLEPARRRPSGIAIRDTSQVSKKVSYDPSQKLKGVQSLTFKEQEAADTIKALKESRKTSRRQSGTRGSSERSGTIPGVPNESTIVSTTSSEGTGTKSGVPNEENVISKEKVILEWGSEQESKYSEEDQRDDEEDDWIYFDKDDEKKDDPDDDKSIDIEMTDDEETKDEFVQGEEQVNDDEDEEMSNAEVEDSGKGDAEISDVAEADVKKTKEVKDDAKKAKLPPTSSSISVSLGFGDQFLKLSYDTSLISTVKDTTDIEINSLLKVKIQSEVQNIQSPSILNVPVFVISELPVLTPVQETPSAVLTPTINLEQESEKSASEILKIKREQAEKQKMSKYTIKSTDKAALKESNTVKDHKRNHDDDEDDDEDRSAGPNQGKKTKRGSPKESESSKKPSTTKETPKGKAPSKGPITGKSATAKEPIEEPIIEVEMDDPVNTAAEDVALNADQLHDDSTQAKDKALKQDWFKQPLRPPTPDPEWNKRQVVLDQLEQPWFNQMVSATKDPLTFNNLMATPIDFFKYVLHRLKIDNLTQDILLGPTYKLLKGTCRPSHLTVAVDYFFNNDLEYLKSFNLERMYTTSIIKTKAARYEIVGFEDMKILGVKSVSVKKLHGYGHLEEIVVKRADRQLYKFKEGDFVDLHLSDIEDISLVIKKHIEDLHLGVESYQKKLNITEPQKTFPEIKFKELYTLSYNPSGFGMSFIIGLNFRLGYNDKMSRRKWTAIDRKRSQLMVELIDKHMHERRIIQNLERLVGARELEMDYKLMTCTKILGVKSVSVKKLHGYGHLEEIVVKRADRQLYKFKEGDFVDLYLSDIEDMLLYAVQRNLFHLNKNDIVDFIVALRVIYEDLNKHKRVMWADELYKFLDGTLMKVWDELHHRILNFRLGYNDKMSRRKWTAIDRKRSQLMVELIDKHMCERRII
ncbi:hypothetical protein Tco_0003743 [Tanacetum coccineum]